jgi:hypothetical protein
MRLARGLEERAEAALLDPLLEAEPRAGIDTVGDVGVRS